MFERVREDVKRGEEINLSERCDAGWPNRTKEEETCL